MNNFTIGIVVPVFNVEQYLPECLDSIVNQKQAPDEVILVNDGSTDNSKLICEEYCKKYTYFHLISQENRGLASARNRGMSVCKTDYILFVDSDDFIHADLVGTVRESMKAGSYDVLMFSAQVQYDIRIGEARSAFVRMAGCNGKTLTGKDYLEATYPLRYIESACLAVYRMKFLLKEEIFFPDGIFFEDSLFTLKVLLNAETVFSIPDMLYTRRCRTGSIITTGINAQKLMDLITLNKLIWNYLKQYGINRLSKRFLMDYIAGNLLHVWNKSSLVTQMEQCQGEMKALFQKFLMTWEGMYAENRKSIGDSAALYLAVRECRNIKESVLQEEIKNGLMMKLKKLPFQVKGKRVIVYGIGLNAAALVDLYQYLVGEIKCSIDYMITDRGGRDIEFAGKKVLDCRDIAEWTYDMIVISSRAYQSDMYEELVRRNITKEKIVTLYNEGDVCDLSVIRGVLDI